jgi:hypothetical protein
MIIHTYVLYLKILSQENNCIFFVRTIENQHLFYSILFYLFYFDAALLLRRQNSIISLDSLELWKSF